MMIMMMTTMIMTMMMMMMTMMMIMMTMIMMMATMIMKMMMMMIMKFFYTSCNTESITRNAKQIMGKLTDKFYSKIGLGLYFVLCESFRSVFR